MYQPAPAPLFDRAMLAAAAPALLLPVLVAVSAVTGAFVRESLGGDSQGILALVVAVYCFVLLGSMTLNGWLLLRHPQTFIDHAASRGISTMLAVLYGLLVLWIVLLAFGIVDWIGLVLGVVIAAHSIVIFIAVLARYLRPGSVPRITSAQLPGWGRGIAVGYLTVATIALLVAVASPFIAQDWVAALGVLGGPQTWALLILGLPWSHPLYFASVVLLFAADDSAGMLALVPNLLMALASIANVALVGLVLFSPTKRAALTNWFFRLGRDRP